MKVSLFNAIKNYASALGTRFDQASHRQYDANKRLDHRLLTSIYRSEWLAGKVVDIPAKDMIRPWRTFSDDQAGNVDKYKQAEKRYRLKSKFLEAVIWSRLYGGSIIIPTYGNAVTEEDLAQPFDINKMRPGTLLGFTVLSQPQLEPEGRERIENVLDHRFGWPVYWRIGKKKKEQLIVHSSWLLHFTGQRKSPIDGCDHNHYSWGDSILERVYEDIERALVALQETSSMMHKLNIDVYKVRELVEQLASCGGDISGVYSILSKRLELVALTSSNHNAVVVDAELEGYERRDLKVTGWDKLTEVFLNTVAGGADIPITRFYGQSPGGLNASGESDLRNYYDGLAGIREDDLQWRLDYLDQILGKELFNNPEQVPSWEWNPLWQLSEKEQADINKTRADTFQIYYNADMPFITALEAENLAREKVYSYTEQQLSEIQSTERFIEPDGED